MRRHGGSSAVCVYYTAAAAVDLAALMLAVPSFVRDVDVLPLSAAHSRPMAYAAWARRAVDPMLRHTAGWLTATAAGVRIAAAARWTSASRVVAFVIFVACVLLDFTRFLDAAVVELTDHCFVGVRLWSVNVTALGRQRFYAELQPAVSTLAGEALPVALSLLFAMMLLVRHLRCCRRRTASSTVDDERRDRRLNVTVLALSTAFVLLDGPTAVLKLVRVFHFRSSAATGSGIWYQLSLIVGCLSLARCAVNCVVVSVVNYDFRKTTRRTFCCCCDDVVACCRRPRQRDRHKQLSWNELEVDYMTAADVFNAARNSPISTAPDSRPHRQTAGQQQDNDISLWI